MSDEPQKPSPPTTLGLERAKVAIEGIRVLAWPLLLAVLLVWFHRPLAEIAQSFSQKFTAANKVSIGALSLEIEKTASAAGNPEIGRQIGQLSPQAIEELLQTPRNGRMILVSTNDDERRRIGVPAPAKLDALQELERRGFLSFTQPIEDFLRQIRELPRDAQEAERHGDDRAWYLIDDAAQAKKLRDQGYELTASGRLAVDAIIKTVAALLVTNDNAKPREHP